MGQRRPCWGPSHQPDDEVTNMPCHPPAARQAQISRTVRPAYTGQETSVGVGTAEFSAVGSHPVHCGWGNGSPGFHPVGAGPPTPSKCRQRKHLWAFPTVSWGQAPACEHSCWSRGGWSGTTDVPTGHSYRKHRDGGSPARPRGWDGAGAHLGDAGEVQGKEGVGPHPGLPSKQWRTRGLALDRGPSSVCVTPCLPQGGLRNSFHCPPTVESWAMCRFCENGESEAQ